MGGANIVQTEAAPDVTAQPCFDQRHRRCDVCHQPFFARDILLQDQQTRPPFCDTSARSVGHLAQRWSLSPAAKVHRPSSDEALVPRRSAPAVGSSRRLAPDHFAAPVRWPSPPKAAGSAKAQPDKPRPPSARSKSALPAGLCFTKRTPWCQTCVAGSGKCARPAPPDGGTKHSCPSSPAASFL